MQESEAALASGRVEIDEDIAAKDRLIGGLRRKGSVGKQVGLTELHAGAYRFADAETLRVSTEVSVTEGKLGTSK